MAFFGVVCCNPFLLKTLREFKSPDGSIGLLGTRPISGFQLQRYTSDAVAQFRALEAERVAVNFFKQSEVEQPILLPAQLGEFTLQIAGFNPCILLLFLRPQPQHLREPIAHFIRLADALEQRQKLLVNPVFG